VCSHTRIQAVPGRRPQIRCDGAIQWSLKWTSHWRSNVVNDVHTSVRTLLKSSNRPTMRPSPRSHASNVVDGVRQTAVDRGRPRLMAWVWMLLKSINARFLITYRPPRSNAAENYGQRSNAVDRWWRLNACERVRRRQWERWFSRGIKWLSLLCYFVEARGSFQETAPRKTAENTFKRRDDGVGSVVANHHDGGESSVIVTTLLIMLFNEPENPQNCPFLLGISTPM